MTLRDLIKKILERVNWKGVMIALVVLISAGADAARDALLNKVSWWEWHAVKWLAVFPVWIALWFQIKAWGWRMMLVGMSWGLWEFVYDLLK